jgi:hypothetical protein
MECVFNLRNHIDRVWDEVEKITIQTSTTKHLIGAMLYVALNHCEAIQVLIQKQNFASANALVRPALETLIRSLWLSHFANDQEINKTFETDKWPKTFSIIEKIENDKETPKIFSRFWTFFKPVMHSYTHGGKENALRQLGNGLHITPNIDEEEVRQVIQLVGFISWSVLSEVSILAENNDIETQLNQIGDDLISWAFKEESLIKV